MNTGRKLFRIARFVPWAFAAWAAQKLYFDRKGDKTTALNFLFKKTRKILGVSVEFNGAANFQKDKQNIFIGNHMSPLDPVIWGTIAKSRFFGKDDVGRMPVIGKAAKDLGICYISRGSHSLEKDRQNMVDMLSPGDNVGYYPEATTTDGFRLHRFNAGLITPAFGHVSGSLGQKLGPYYHQPVLVQPLAIQVDEVCGNAVSDQPDLQEYYTWHGDEQSLPEYLWTLAGVKSMKIKLTAVPPLDPQQYGCHKDMMNEAHKRVAAIVAPNQKTVEVWKKPQGPKAA